MIRDGALPEHRDQGLRERRREALGVRGRRAHRGGVVHLACRDADASAGARAHSAFKDQKTIGKASWGKDDLRCHV